MFCERGIKMKKNLAIMMIFAMLLMFYGMPVTISAEDSIHYNVLYYGNGNTNGDPPEDRIDYAANATATVLNGGTLVKTGYLFFGWNTAANGSGTSYAVGSTFNITANTSLYAQWTVRTYTISYNGNGNTSGTAPADAANYAYNTAVTVLGAGTLIRVGYTFSGWNTAANGSGTNRTVGSTFNITANTTLYAKWTINSNLYTVSYN
jgi:uncharacterized repeat protein (TIGR02543 family)